MQCNMRVISVKKNSMLMLVLIQLVLLIVNSPAESQTVQIYKTDEAITIDGRLSEAVWSNVQPVTGFTQLEPEAGAPSSQITFVRIMYDDNMIYFGFDCRDTDPSRISSKITNRDGAMVSDDAVGIMLDTFNDGSNAYLFMINSLGTQQDERWADNGRTRDLKWDANWISSGKVNGDGWTAEVGIPFAELKFDRKMSEWGLNVGRSIPRNLELSFWKGDLTEWFRVSEYGKITGLDLSEVLTKKYTFIPYVQSQVEKGAKSTGEAGLNFRYTVSSNTSLETTFNPDFATIEADVEQVNLTRFELRYPEKRPFFLEGGENYSTRIRQFYSRRIGEIPWGAKLNGKQNMWKFNMLSTQSDPSSANPNIPEGKDANYTVFRIGRNLKNSSNIGVIGANRNYNGSNKGSLGLVSTLFFTKALGMTSQVVRSYGDFGSGAWTYFFRPSYDTHTSHFHVRYSHVGTNVRENMNDIGFITDDDRREIDTNIRKTFWLNKYGIEYIRPSNNYNIYYGQTGILRSWKNNSDLEIKFLKNWEFILEHEEEFKRYEKDFRNRITEVELNYDSHEGEYIELGFGRGKNFDSTVEQIHAEVDLKLLEGLNVSYNLTKYWFSPEGNEDNTLIHYVRSTYYVNKDLFFKLFYQSKYDVTGGFSEMDFDLDRETIQFVFVWRFLPPFGSLQLSYQQGTTRVTETTGYGKTMFSKLSWVF